jgi:hypothetical protein
METHDPHMGCTVLETYDEIYGRWQRHDNSFMRDWHTIKSTLHQSRYDSWLASVWDQACFASYQAIFPVVGA